MKAVTVLAVMIFFCWLGLPLSAQETSAETEDVVNLSQDATLNEAIRVLETRSLKYRNKNLLNLSSYNGPVGVPLNNIPWFKAAELIALNNNLAIQESPGFFAFINAKDTAEGASVLAGPDINTKQVRINAIALVADRAYLKSLGIDWSTVFDGKVTVNADFSGAGQVPSSLFSLGGDTDFAINGTQIELSTLLKAIESNQKGSVIAKPNIMVSSGNTGFIQVGQDVSVKTVDDAGNTTDTFFATGVILEVKPTIVPIGDTEVVHLTISIERSSATPGNISTIINKSKSKTELVLYDGEETVIGGLYDTDTIHTRGGIPILKDLPWWVLGLRYLTGYNKVETKERELVIVIRPDIVDNAVDRMNKAKEDPVPSKVPPEAGDWSYRE